MPFADYDDFDACVRDNSDKNDPEAYCAAIKREVEGELSKDEEQALQDGDPCWEGYTMVGMKEGPNGPVPNCVPDEDVPDANMSQRITVSRSFSAGEEQIERVEESDGSIRYKNITLLSPGEWTDSKSRTTFYYSPEGIKNSVDNWEDNKLHLNHDGQDTVLAEIGHVDTDTVRATSEGRMVGDIVFHMRTPTSEEAEALMELAYDTNGEQGPGGPSVEIMDTKDEFDDARGMMETTEMTFSGVGIVTHPAAQDISFDEQMAALESNAQKAGVRLMSQSQTDKDTETKTESMDEETDESPIQKLRNVREDLDRELMDGEYEMAMDAVESYLGSNETSDSDSVAEMVDWVEENLDDALVSAASMMVEKFMEEEGVEELGEVDVSLFADFVASMNDGEDEMMEKHEDEEDEEDEEEDMEMSELKERVSELESKITKMRENQGEVVEELSALTDTLQGVNKELQAVKDEPQPRALSESLEDDNAEDEETQTLYAGEMTGTRSFSVR